MTSASANQSHRGTKVAVYRAREERVYVAQRELVIYGTNESGNL